MHGSAALVAGLLAAGALAAPTRPSRAAHKRNFKVAVKGSRGKSLSPAKEMEKVFAKYGWLEKGLSPFGVDDTDAITSIFGPTVTTSTTTQNAPHVAAGNGTSPQPGASGTPTTDGDGSAEVTSTPESNDSEYLTPVTVGGQQLTLDFDTGSADLWVFSTSLSSSDWLLDGFPRTLGQAQMLDDMLSSKSSDLQLVVNLDVPEEIILDRILNRWTHLPSGRVYNLTYNPPKTPGKDDITGEPLSKREDDNVETFANRLKSFHKQTEPMLQHYRQKSKQIIDIDCRTNSNPSTALSDSKGDELD